MKRLFLLCVLTLLLASCSINNDNTNDFYTEIVPIDSVEMPTEFRLGETYEIHVKYLRPSGCYLFYNFYYASELNQRTIAVINSVYPNHTCETFDNDLVDVSFTFKVINEGTYIFKFWKGEDEYGNDTYYIVEVPVVD